MGDDTLLPDDESLPLEGEDTEVEIPQQLLEQELDDGLYTVVDNEVYEVVRDKEGNPFLKKLGEALDDFAEEELLAMKNIMVQVFDVGKNTAKHIGAFSYNPDFYINDQKEKLARGLKRIRKGLRKTFTGIAQAPGKAATGARDSVRNTGRRVGQSVKDLGDRVKEEGITGMAAGVVRKAGEGLEGAVSAAAEGKLASPDDLYVPGFEGMLIGDYLPETPYEGDARDVRNFLLSLKDDYETFPLDLGLGERRNGQTREKILEDFLHYGTTQPRMLLMHLGLRRADFANDPDRTLTKTQIDVLSGPIGARITEMRDLYIGGGKEG